MSARGPTATRRWLWLVVILLGCMIAGLQSQSPDPRDAGFAAEALSLLARPFVAVFGGLGRGLGEVGQRVARLGQLERDNERLRQEVARLEGLVEQAEEQRQEAARLRGLLALQAPFGGQTRPARVIAAGPSPWYRTLTLDIGRRQGVEPGAVVLGAEGVLGQVYRVEQGTCRVLCLTDRLARLGARLQPERCRQVLGVCQGDGSELLQLVFGDAEADVRPGDPVVTSGRGRGSRAPAGLPIGRVVTVERRPDESSLICSIRPAATEQRTVEVLVAIGGEPGS